MYVKWLWKYLKEQSNKKSGTVRYLTGTLHFSSVWFGPFFIRSGSYSGYVKFEKPRQNFKKMEMLHIFRCIFNFFQANKINIKISKEILIKEIRCLNWFLANNSRIQIRFFKLWFVRSGQNGLDLQPWTTPQQHHKDGLEISYSGLRNKAPFVGMYRRAGQITLSNR